LSGSHRFGDKKRFVAVLDTALAKSTLAALEVDFWQAKFIANNDLGFANTNATLALRAAIDKEGFTEDPWEPERGIGTEFTAQESTSGWIS
jgi:hypothetical protein